MTDELGREFADRCGFDRAKLSKEFASLRTASTFARRSQVLRYVLEATTELVILPDDTFCVAEMSDVRQSLRAGGCSKGCTLFVRQKCVTIPCNATRRASYPFLWKGSSCSFIAQQLATYWFSWKMLSVKSVVSYMLWASHEHTVD